MAKYAKVPCTCGSSRVYWRETQWNDSNPFCGDCHRLLDTEKTGLDGMTTGQTWLYFFAIPVAIGGVVILAIVGRWT